MKKLFAVRIATGVAAMFLTSAVPGYCQTVHAKSFVYRLFIDFEGHPPDASQEIGFAVSLDQGWMSQGTVGTVIIDSKDTRKAMVARFFQAYLNRAPTTAEMNSWTTGPGRLWAFRHIRGTIMASDEFFQIAAAKPKDAWWWDANDQFLNYASLLVSGQRYDPASGIKEKLVQGQRGYNRFFAAVDLMSSTTADEFFCTNWATRVGVGTGKALNQPVGACMDIASKFYSDEYGLEGIVDTPEYYYHQ